MDPNTACSQLHIYEAAEEHFGTVALKSPESTVASGSTVVTTPKDIGKNVWVKFTCSSFIHHVYMLDGFNVKMCVQKKCRGGVIDGNCGKSCDG